MAGMSAPSGRILVIDDEEDSRDLVAHILREAITTCRSPPTATRPSP
jgi:CheY-like chemotaxis protein